MQAPPPCLVVRGCAGDERAMSGGGEGGGEARQGLFCVQLEIYSSSMCVCVCVCLGGSVCVILSMMMFLMCKKKRRCVSLCISPYDDCVCTATVFVCACYTIAF